MELKNKAPARPLVPPTLGQSPGYQELSNWGVWIGNRKVYLTQSKLVWTRPEPPPIHPVPSAPVSTARVCFWEVSPFSFLPQMRASIRPTLDPGKGPRRLEKSSCEEMGSWVVVEGVGVVGGGREARSTPWGRRWRGCWGLYACCRRAPVREVGGGWPYSPKSNLRRKEGKERCGKRRPCKLSWQLPKWPVSQRES